MKIQKSFKEQDARGKLYLVPTPIGNLQDMTFRAIETLKSVDFICSEDTRNTGLLLKYFEIGTKQISFHEHNAYEKIPDLIGLLKEGKSLAQVSDAGMPSISDPGHDLVKAAIVEDISVIALPGASAGITALIASGLIPQPHIFYGFLPRKVGAQKQFLESKKGYPETQIFYESPFRVLDTLKTIKMIYGDREVVLVRELTKLFEEYQRGSVSEVIAYLTEHSLKGECLLIISGFTEVDVGKEEVTEQLLIQKITGLIAEGYKPNQAIKEVTKSYRLNRQDVYNLYHAQK